LLIEDYFIHRLTGRFVAEGSLLCSTAYWDLRAKRYWPRMLGELGLVSSTIVTTGALDQAYGALGVGNVRPGIFSECTGSNVAVVALVDRPRIARRPCGKRPPPASTRTSFAPARRRGSRRARKGWCCSRTSGAPGFRNPIPGPGGCCAGWGCTTPGAT
jgi:hypothetical protein